jgi:hypothetical protein
MGCECRSSRTRGVLEFIAFLAVLAIGVVLIVDDRVSSAGLDAAAYLTSVYSAWRAGGVYRRETGAGPGR